MKSILVSKPLVFSLEVIGDHFRQGDTLNCSLSVENTSAGPIPIENLILRLGRIDLKKLKKRDPDFCVELVDSCKEIQNFILEANSKTSIPWSVRLDHNCAITDAGQSLCLLYGLDSDAGSTGNLQLTVKPHMHIEQVFETCESFFQFIPKTLRWVDGWVELKLKPPTSRSLAFVDELLLGIRFDQESLALRYNFKLSVFDTASLTGKVKKKGMVVEQKLDPTQYLLTADHLNQHVLQLTIEEALKSVATTI